MYEHQKAQFSVEMERYRRLEEKAGRYLSYMTFAIGAYFIVAKWAIDELVPSKLVDCVAIFMILFTFASFVSSWSFCFRATRLEDIVKVSSGNEMIEYFLDNCSGAVLLGLSRRYAQAIESIDGYYSLKLYYVRKAYSEIAFSMGCLCTSVFLILIKYWVS
ncbi:hypothetical protein [Xanthomonas campestris]|nr:hypothetical protein [Xanthomonas campestris]MEA9559113.1 hypothetical protein [Xanthomonas campestris]MEA9723685.1 hypothetical protein [Xanthomonas campestris]